MMCLLALKKHACTPDATRHLMPRFFWRCSMLLRHVECSSAAVARSGASSTAARAASGEFAAHRRYRRR